MFESELLADPIEQFGIWFEAARAAGVAQPEAMALATASPEGKPSVRFVLLKSWDQRGFVFFTNRESQKGLELLANPSAALAIHWQPLGRQFRAQGPVSLATDEESDAYFDNRPRSSQISAAISPQSRPVPSREWLEEATVRFESQAAGGPVARPSNWGGFVILPEVIEFWQHQDDRLHDRLVYHREASGDWRRDRLAP